MSNLGPQTPTANRIAAYSGTSGLIKEPDAALSANGQRVTALADASGSTDAVTKSQLDTVSAATTAASIASTVSAAKRPLEFIVEAALAATLPSYVKTGSAGSEVLTMSANGAFTDAQFDQVTLVTGDIVLVPYNDTSTPDSGMFVVTQGTGGTPAVLTRWTGANTAALLGAARVTVARGRRYRGRVFVAQLTTAELTLGTTPLLFKLQGDINGAHGLRLSSDFSDAYSTGATLTLCGASTNTGYAGAALRTSGTATSIVATHTGNTQSKIGKATFSTGSTSTGLAELSLPDIRFSTESIVEFEINFQNPVASDGTNTFAMTVGFYADANNAAFITAASMTNGVAISMTPKVAGVDGSAISCGTVTVATDYTLRFVKEFGTSALKVYVNGTLMGTTGSLSTSVSFRGLFYILKSFGATARTLEVDWFTYEYYSPKARGA